jgi:hypothetical protein
MELKKGVYLRAAFPSHDVMPPRAIGDEIRQNEFDRRTARREERSTLVAWTNGNEKKRSHMKVRRT